MTSSTFAKKWLGTRVDVVGLCVQTTHAHKGWVGGGSRKRATPGRVKAGKNRAELFSPDLEMRKLIVRFLENRLKKQLDAGSTRLATLQRALPSGRSAAAEVLRKRLSSLQDWHSKARALLPVAKTFLKLGS